MPIFYLDSGSIDNLEISSSLLVSGTFVLSGSLQTSGGGVTASLSGTASWANSAVTSSYVTGSVFTSNNPALTASYALSSSFALSASWAPGGASLSGGQDKYIARWNSTTSITTSSLYEGDNKNIAINATVFDGTNPEALLVSGSSINVISGEANINTYTQLNIINNNSGNASSADIVATNNTGNEFGNFVDLGINGSNYAGILGSPNDGYLFNTGSNFIIGNTTRGNNANLKLFAGNDATVFPVIVTGSVVILTGSLLGTASSIGRLSQDVTITGSVIISGSAQAELFVLGDQQITGSLRITNGVIAQTITGSFTGSLTGELIGTASWASRAVSASYVTGSIFTSTNPALSASFALSSSQATSASLAAALTGGINRYISRWSSPTTVTTSSMYEGPNNNIGINKITFDPADPEALVVLTNTINAIRAEASLNNYIQINIQNLSNGSAVSSDIVCTSNGGNEFGNFVDLGINGSNYGGQIGVDNEAYLFNTGSTFLIGNQTRGVNAAVKFFAGNDGTIFPLIVTGSVIIATGSLLGTASYVTGSVYNAANPALSSSFALTSSFASTASFALSVSGFSAFPFAGLAVITGSIIVSSGSGVFAPSPALTASEALTAGDFINIGAGGVRRATSNDTTKQVHGYVLNSYVTNNSVVVYYSGLNTSVTGLTAGSRYWLGTTGGSTTTPPTTVGQLSQEIGVAVSSTALLVNIGPAIVT